MKMPDQEPKPADEPILDRLLKHLDGPPGSHIGVNGLHRAHLESLAQRTNAAADEDFDNTTNIKDKEDSNDRTNP